MGTTRITLSEPPPRLTGKRQKKKKPDNSASHESAANSFGVVYVNEVARNALLNEEKPEFPASSVIVREKLLQPNDAVPQVMVVMVKRERGFNSKANDWEFLMIDGSMSKTTRREKTGSCRDCHMKQKDSDFVFRSYLPASIRLGQKLDLGLNR